MCVVVLRNVFDLARDGGFVEEREGVGGEVDQGEGWWWVGGVGLGLFGFDGVEDELGDLGTDAGLSGAADYDADFGWSGRSGHCVVEWVGLIDWR